MITLSEINNALATHERCQRFYNKFGFQQAYDRVAVTRWLLNGGGV